MVELPSKTCKPLALLNQTYPSSSSTISLNKPRSSLAFNFTGLKSYCGGIDLNEMFCPIDSQHTNANKKAMAIYRLCDNSLRFIQMYFFYLQTGRYFILKDTRKNPLFIVSLFYPSLDPISRYLMYPIIYWVMASVLLFTWSNLYIFFTWVLTVSTEIKRSEAMVW
jgi:hypothetical protein